MIFNFNRFWSVCGDLALFQAKCLQYFNEFSRVSVITQLDFSRNGRLCDLRFMCLLYADMNRHNWGINISRGSKVFHTHLAESSNSSHTYSYISVLPTYTTSQTSVHIGEAFMASNSLPLGSAMKPNYEQFDLPTVTHQNGFSSTIAFGVPTFVSRIADQLRKLERLSCHQSLMCI